jgi:hypothetical protein
VLSGFVPRNILEDPQNLAKHDDGRGVHCRADVHERHCWSSIRTSTHLHFRIAAQMRQSMRLLQHSLRLTLFTHEHCSLCVDVKAVMSKVWDRRHFEYSEVDIKAPDQKHWHHLYELDIPVVGPSR